MTCERRRPGGRNGVQHDGQSSQFHTDTVEAYEPEEKWRYHDNDECYWGNKIKADGNEEPSDAGRKLCDRCATLAAEEAKAASGS